MKVVYEDIAYGKPKGFKKHTKWCVFVSKNAQSLLWGLSLGVGQ